MLIRAIDATLNEWAHLDKAHKGVLYDEAVKHLVDWKKELDKEIHDS